MPAWNYVVISFIIFFMTISSRSIPFLVFVTATVVRRFSYLEFFSPASGTSFGWVKPGINETVLFFSRKKKRAFTLYANKNLICHLILTSHKRYPPAGYSHSSSHSYKTHLSPDDILPKTWPRYAIFLIVKTAFESEGPCGRV